MMKREVDIDRGVSGVPEDQPNIEVTVTWNNRRRMAWLAMFTIVGITAGVSYLIPMERLEQIQDILGTILWVLFGVIASYMGFTAIPWFGKGKL